MGLNAKTASGGGGGTKQPPIEVGGYPARVVQLIDLGVQNQRPFKNKVKPPAHQFHITYELVDEFCLKMDEDTGDITDEYDESKPRWLSEDLVLHNLKNDRATSTKRYNALDPDGDQDGDFVGLINTPCIVSVDKRESQANGRVYNNITGVATMRAKQADSCPELVNPPKVFILDDPDIEVFFSLPEWLQEKIKGNHNFEGSLLQRRLKGKDESPPVSESSEDASTSGSETKETGETSADDDTDW